jgi:signal transduction histidine kinase
VWGSAVQSGSVRGDLEDHLPVRTPQATPRAGGGGLGLAIVRDLVEAHGGKVTADNTGVSCRFVIRLPATRQG